MHNTGKDHRYVSLSARALAMALKGVHTCSALMDETHVIAESGGIHHVVVANDLVDAAGAVTGVSVDLGAPGSVPIRHAFHEEHIFVHVRVTTTTGHQDDGASGSGFVPQLQQYDG